MRSIYIAVLLIVWNANCSGTTTDLTTTASTSASITSVSTANDSTQSQSTPSESTTESESTTTEATPSQSTSESTTESESTTTEAAPSQSTTSESTTESESTTPEATPSQSTTSELQTESDSSTTEATSESLTPSTTELTIESTSELSPSVTTSESTTESESTTTNATINAINVTSPFEPSTNELSTTTNATINAINVTSPFEPSTSELSPSSIQTTNPAASSTNTASVESTGTSNQLDSNSTGSTTSATPESGTSDTSPTSGSQPTSESSPSPTNSLSTSQIPITTSTTPRPPTTTIDINKNYTINTENAVLSVPINITFNKSNCPTEDLARSEITMALLKIDIAVTKTKSYPCINGSESRRKRSNENIGGISFEAVVNARYFIANETFKSVLNTTLGEILNNSVMLLNTDGAFDLTMCDTDVCRQASLEYIGFTCYSGSDRNCTFKSKCFNKTCGYGECEVKANGSHYYSVCKCKEADMYKYTVSADKCVKGDLSYKAWMIIAAGAGGLIILILLFAIVIQCARRKGVPSNPEKFAYDIGYNDRETLMHDRSYDHIDQYHRKPSLKVEDRRVQTSLQTFDNQGYDHWDPDESKETYQSMDRHFQSPNFQSQITRPKITTNRYGEDKLTPF